MACSATSRLTGISAKAASPGAVQADAGQPAARARRSRSRPASRSGAGGASSTRSAGLTSSAAAVIAPAPGGTLGHQVGRVRRPVVDLGERAGQQRRPGRRAESSTCSGSAVAGSAQTSTRPDRGVRVGRGQPQPGRRRGRPPGGRAAAVTGSPAASREQPPGQRRAAADRPAGGAATGGAPTTRVSWSAPEVPDVLGVAEPVGVALADRGQLVDPPAVGGRHEGPDPGAAGEQRGDRLQPRDLGQPELPAALDQPEVRPGRAARMRSRSAAGSTSSARAGRVSPPTPSNPAAPAATSSPRRVTPRPPTPFDDSTTTCVDAVYRRPADLRSRRSSGTAEPRQPGRQCRGRARVVRPVPQLADHVGDGDEGVDPVALVPGRNAR